MKVETADGSKERQVLVGMALNKKVLGPISAVWDDVNFSSPWANLVGDWCVKHFKQFGTAPGLAALEQYVTEWGENDRVDRATVKLVENFFVTLESERHRNGDAPKSDYLLAQAQLCFTKRALISVTDDVQKLLQKGDVDSANKCLQTYQRQEHANTELRSTVSFSEPLSWKESMRKSLETKSETLIKYGQAAMDNFFERSLQRDGFIGFMGKSKVGKSFWLLDIAMRAVAQGRNVYYVQAGDMSEGQIMNRIHARVLRRPILASSLVRLPLTIERTGKYAEAQYKDISYKKDLKPEELKEGLALAAKRYDKRKLRLETKSNRGITIHKIRQNLESFKRHDGWNADVVVIDYMDILQTVNDKLETRHSVNENWTLARSISQDFHCLLVAGTQSDTDSFGREVLRRDNFTEARQVLDHVTGMVGINQDAKEKANQVYRLNWIVSRECTFPEDLCVHCAGCLDISKPCMQSCF